MSKSILSYFSAKSGPKKTGETSNDSAPQIPVITAVTDISQDELSSILDEIDTSSNITSKRVRATYSEEEKLRIAKYAHLHTPSRAVKYFIKDFPNLRESTVRPWLTKFRGQLSDHSKLACGSEIRIGTKRGRPLRLPDELDGKLRSFMVHLRSAGGTINRNVVYGILMGLIKSNLNKWGSYLDFNVTNGWIDYLYRRLNFSRRCATTSRPTITRLIWTEIRHLYLYNIAEVVLRYSIPDALIINVDQTPSKYVCVDKTTMAEKGSKHVSKRGSDDKRAITATLSETLSGQILPFQLIYTGKTKRSLPDAQFPKGFSLSYNPSHWSNEEETLRLINDVIKPYIEGVKKELDLPEGQKTLIIWDAFKAQECPSVKQRLKELNIEHVQVPKNLTHLLQPLDLTTNRTVKKLERESFTEYFTNCITTALADDPGRDVTTIKIDTRLSTLKPLHAKCMARIYNHLKSTHGERIICSGWRAAGIRGAVDDARMGVMPTLDPFH